MIAKCPQYFRDFFFILWIDLLSSAVFFFLRGKHRSFLISGPLRINVLKKKKVLVFCLKCMYWIGMPYWWRTTERFFLNSWTFFRKSWTHLPSNLHIQHWGVGYLTGHSQNISAVFWSIFHWGFLFFSQCKFPVTQLSFWRLNPISPPTPSPLALLLPWNGFKVVVEILHARNVTPLQ